MRWKNIQISALFENNGDGGVVAFQRLWKWDEHLLVFPTLELDRALWERKHLIWLKKQSFTKKP